MAMRRRWIYLLGLAAFGMLPERAWANGGTPLLWATLEHLVVGNLLIGLGEGLLLAWWFGTAWRKSLWVMILANYFSAWVGLLLLRMLIVANLPLDLNNARLWLWIMVVVTYAMTVGLEWPFVAHLFRGRTDTGRRTMRASLAVQAASYVVLFGWYWGASQQGLYREMTVVSPQALALATNIQVYYIGEQDGAIYRRGLMENSGQRVFVPQPQDRLEWLFARRQPGDKARWEIMADIAAPEQDMRREAVLKGQTLKAAAEWQSNREEGPPWWIGHFKIAELANSASGEWEYRGGYSLDHGFNVRNRRTSEQFHCAYNTPFGTWRIRNVVHLPNDMALFQLGKNQICVCDAATRQVALLWHGRGPLPVIVAGEAK